MTASTSDWLMLDGPAYQFWSGIGTTVFIPLAFYWAHRCHQRGCWRWGHPDPEHGWPACRRHHSRPPA